MTREPGSPPLGRLGMFVAFVSFGATGFVESGYFCQVVLACFSVVLGAPWPHATEDDTPAATTLIPIMTRRMRDAVVGRLLSDSNVMWMTLLDGSRSHLDEPRLRS